MFKCGSGNSEGVDAALPSPDEAAVAGGGNVDAEPKPRWRPPPGCGALPGVGGAVPGRPLVPAPVKKGHTRRVLLDVRC